MTRTPQGPALVAIMYDHDRGPQYALVQCIHPDCTTEYRIANSNSLSDRQVTGIITGLGWHATPTLCPVHAKPDATIGWVLIERQYHQDAALIYPTHEAALDALENDLLVDSLCEEDCLDAWSPETIAPSELSAFEVIIPD